MGLPSDFQSHARVHWSVIQGSNQFPLSTFIQISGERIWPSWILLNTSTLVFIPNSQVRMCNYTQVEFECGHRRYTVRAWCTNYETTHRRCPPAVVAVEWRLVIIIAFDFVCRMYCWRVCRLDERCGSWTVLLCTSAKYTSLTPPALGDCREPAMQPWMKYEKKNSRA